MSDQAKALPRKRPYVNPSHDVDTNSYRLSVHVFGDSLHCPSIYLLRQLNALPSEWETACLVLCGGSSIQPASFKFAQAIGSSLPAASCFRPLSSSRSPLDCLSNRSGWDYQQNTLTSLLSYATNVRHSKGCGLPPRDALFRLVWSVSLVCAPDLPGTIDFVAPRLCTH